MAFTPLRGKPAQANTPTALGHQHGASTASITAAWNATTSPGRCGHLGGIDENPSEPVDIRPALHCCYRCFTPSHQFLRPTATAARHLSLSSLLWPITLWPGRSEEHTSELQSLRH